MSNHIPGPLYAIDGLIYKDFGDTRYKIAEVDPYVWDDVESTAHLMAAAPELLESLQDAIALYGKFGAIVNDPHAPGEWITKAKEAVRRATE